MIFTGNYQRKIKKATDFTGVKSITQQHLAGEANINSIMARFEKTGFIPLKQGNPIYADFTKVPDFQTANQMVIDAYDAFMHLPAEVRDRFGNDPQKLINFVSDIKNREEAIKLGLITPPEPKKATIEDETVSTLKSIQEAFNGAPEEAQEIAKKVKKAAKSS